MRERQAEERQRRLEELKRHALEAQQFREQKEIERRRRMEDSRQKENERRTQVGHISDPKKVHTLIIDQGVYQSLTLGNAIYLYNPCTINCLIIFNFDKCTPV